MESDTDSSQLPSEQSIGNVEQSREDFEPAGETIPREMDIADDSHPIKEALDGEYRHELRAHDATVGERFTFRYGEANAFIREYLANAETGCIRRARHELRAHDGSTYDSAWFDSHDIPELLEEAREVVGYYPVIETFRSEPGSQKARFKIKDNGVGISVEEFKAVRELGLSPSHDVGSQVGSFGQGLMSVFNASGKHGELELTTWSMLDGANYRERFRMRGFTDLDGKRDEIGTTWKIPAFCEEARDMDIDGSIERFTQGMFVPVIHHKLDETGTEQAKEEYTYSPLVDMVPDDEPHFVYEDESIEAVMSPAIGTHSSKIDPLTFLVTMPIKRGDDLGSRSAPFGFHIRVKQEDGRVYHSGGKAGKDYSGLVPVEQRRYENEQIDAKGALRPDQMVPGDLFGYDIDDGDHYHVPTGVDDELVRAEDHLTLWPGADQPESLDHPATDANLNPVVVKGPHEGKDIVDDETWVSIDTDVPNRFASRDNLRFGDVGGYNHGDRADPPCDVKLVEPVDDRDRLRDHDGNMLEVVSARLRDVLIEQASVLFEQLRDDGFDVWYDFNEVEREVFTVAYEKYLHSDTSPTSQATMGIVKEKFGVKLPQEICEQLVVLSREIEHAPRGGHTPNRKSGRTGKPIHEVLREAGVDGDVYMGATVHAKKAELAWELGDDNQVVAVDGASKYPEYEDLFDWTPLRELSLHNIQKKYDIDTDVAERLERNQSSSNNNGGGVSIDELEAKSREIKVRPKRKRSYTSSTPKTVKDELNGEDGFLDGYRKNVRHLLVYRETDVEGVQVGRRSCIGCVERTIVPNYVADYLEDVDRCYIVEGDNTAEATEKIRQEMLTNEIETIDIDSFIDYTPDQEPDVTVNADIDTSTEPTPLAELGEETVAIALSTRLNRIVSDGSDNVEASTAIGTIVRALAEKGAITPRTQNIAFIKSDDVDRSIFVWESPMQQHDIEAPSIVRHKTVNNIKTESTRWKPSSSILLDILLPKETFNRDSKAWDYFVKGNKYDIRKNRKKGTAIVDMLHHQAEVVPDDEEVLPSN